MLKYSNENETINTLQRPDLCVHIHTTEAGPMCSHR
ncbi:MAG: hypothetical protein ACI9VM_000658, partial [Candidatus Azotimanducaceae bacterium]